jgi:hypothetical protein
MEYIPFDAAFNALSESRVKKMAQPFSDTLFIKKLPPDPV